MKRSSLKPTDLATISERSLERVALSNISLSGATLRGANMRGSLLRRVDLSGADLEDADLTGALLIGVDLRGARLVAAHLIGATLIDVALEGAKLERARMDRALISSTSGLEPLLVDLEVTPPHQTTLDLEPELIEALGEQLAALELAGYEADGEVELALMEIFDKEPRWKRPAWALGDYYRRTGDAASAIWAYSRAIDVAPRDGYAVFRSSALQIASGQPRRALELLANFEAVGPPNTLQHQLIARHRVACHLALGDATRAQHIGEQALSDALDDVELRIQLAEIAYRTGAARQAIAHLERASAMAPLRTDLKVYIAEICAETLLLPAHALTLLLALLDDEPDHAPALRQLIKLSAKLVNSGVAGTLNAPPPAANSPASAAFALERAGAAEQALFLANDLEHSDADRVKLGALIALDRKDKARAALDSTSLVPTDQAIATFVLRGREAALSAVGQRPDPASPLILHHLRFGDAATHAPRTPAALAALGARWWGRLESAADAERWSAHFDLGDIAGARLDRVTLSPDASLVLHIDAPSPFALHLYGLDEPAQRHRASAPHLRALAEAGYGGAPLNPGRPLLDARHLDLSAIAATAAPASRPPLALPSLAGLPSIPGALPLDVALDTARTLLHDPDLPTWGSTLALSHWWTVLEHRLPRDPGFPDVADACYGARFVLSPAGLEPPTSPPVSVLTSAHMATCATALDALTHSALLRATGALIWPPGWAEPRSSGEPMTTHTARFVVGSLVALSALKSVDLLHRSQQLLTPAAALPTADSTLRRATRGLEALARGYLDPILEGRAVGVI